MNTNKKIICENNDGVKVEFKYAFPYFLSEYSGIHEFSGDVATIKSAFGVGVSYIGTSVNKRNITITTAFKNDENLQTRRDLLYKVFSLKSKGILYYYENDVERKIEYYVESIKPVKKKVYSYMSISLLCPSPYFMDLVETIAKIQNWDSLLEFPLEIPSSGIEFGRKNNSTMATIDNSTNIEFGMTIKFTCTGDVENPILTNASTQETMKINHSLHNGESIVITTYTNNKTIKFIDNVGNEKNIINCLVFGTKFLQVSKGENKFKPSADVGKEYLQTEISYSNYYEAI